MAAILSALAATARGDGPLTAGTAGLDAAGRQAVREAIEAALMAERAAGGPDRDTLIRLLAGWDWWMRHT